jgi:nickel-type superoxide dismutase maturation protease
MHVGPTLPTVHDRENCPSPQSSTAVARANSLVGHLAGAALGAGVVLATALVAVSALAIRRVAVSGRSMAPTLVPGDRLVVVRIPARWPLPSGALVAVPDPREGGHLLVKRATPAGDGTLRLLGDNPVESTDSRVFGPVPRRAVWGRVVYRYAPSARAGLLR